jgi:hypothetical protein
MRKILLTVIFLVSSMMANAQVTSPLLNCNPPEGYGFPFTAKFSKQQATVSFKGSTYKLNYSGAKVDFEGKRWSEYSNDEIRVSTTFPLNNWISIFVPSQQRAIAGDNCK